MALNDAEGGDDGDEDSWKRLSDEIGDIVPGLDFAEDAESGGGAVGQRRAPSKAKRGPMGKGRNMGKFGRGRRRGGGPQKAKGRMLRTTPSGRNLNIDDEDLGVEMAEQNKKKMLIPMAAQQSATLTVNEQYVDQEVEDDLDDVLSDLGYEEE